MIQTKPRADSNAALLVALESDLRGACTVVLRSLDLKVEAAADVAAACERIPALQPVIVVAPEEAKAFALADLEDRAIAVGAEIVWVKYGDDRTELVAVLARAASAAADRAARRG